MVLRRVTGIVGITNDLIQSQAGFLKGAKNLRLGPKLFLGTAQQAKNGAADDDKNGDRNHQFQQRKSRLNSLLVSELHFSTMVSRVTGKNGALPPRRRTPTMKRLPVGFPALAYVMTAQRTS